MAVERVFLVGLSGSGKSTVGRLVADRLGWEFADSDDMIERESGRTVEEIFRAEGEGDFREREADVLEQLSSRPRLVIATGGGAPTNERSRAAIASGLVIWLDVTPEQAVRRLLGDPGGATRPLLSGAPLARLNELFTRRKPLYEQSDHSIAVDYYSPAQVASRIAEIVRMADAKHWEPGSRQLDPEVPASLPGIAATVTTSTASYPVVVEPRCLARLGAICHSLDLRGRAFLLSDTAIAPLFGAAVAASLQAAGFRVERFEVPAGERHKTLATVERIYDWLLAARVERSDFMVCLGGGVITDMGGFAAATVLRGIDFVHVPTTLLGMVDAAIGGKTGVDHRLGKNLIGAFAQPRAVVVDPDVLESLPEREVCAGAAEVLKHGFILDEAMVAEIESAADPLSAVRSPAVIARNTAIKAAVVSGDEREAGARTLLNYGHTLGHAIESVTGYSRYLHGEAVAIGMRAAGMIAVEIGLLSQADFERQQRLVRAVGLPEAAPGLDVDAVIAATAGDKKVRGGTVRWVLLERIGRATTRTDIPPEVVRRAAAEVLR